MVKFNPIGRSLTFVGAPLFSKSKLLGMMAGFCVVAAAAHAETLGYVVTTWDFAGQYTDQGKIECPNGFNPDNRDNFRAQFKTDQERE